MPQELDFQAIRLKLASPEEILGWSHGEVKKPETINYRTQRPEMDGLFCEKTFGPTRDWQCYCGKYKRIRYKGIVCDRCGVEVTRSLVRRERMGHIKLASPVSHIWFLEGVPSRIGLLLDLSVQKLEKVVYFTSYIITFVDEEAKQGVQEELKSEYKSKQKALEAKFNKQIAQVKQEKLAKAEKEKELSSISKQREEKISSFKDSYNKATQELKEMKKLEVISELEYRDLSLKYGQVFQASMGAEAIRKLLSEIDLRKSVKDLETALKKASLAQRKKLGQRLRLVKGFIRAKMRPEWMILTIVPVLPPDLRPMVQLDGGRFASSDLNDLYRRIINRNNRLKRLIELNAPEVICRNEKRMLQEAVDALIDNQARHGRAVAAGPQRRILRSLADMLRGKQGRFRQNLLGKRVDYSGRSVIVVGSELKLHQCGVPKGMALELFKPYVIHKLIKKELAHNVRSASKLVDEGRPEVWDELEGIISDYYVLLNRAPTLHRLGIQAFQPVLIEGKAIRVHPMVCAAFNADFDGDQMAIHVPLTPHAQREAKEIMASTLNLLKPAIGEPITTASKDIALGIYWMTKIKEGVKGEGKNFASAEEAILAYLYRLVDIRAKVKVKIKNKIQETCIGRIYFNQIMPQGEPFINQALDKKALGEIVSTCLERYGTKVVCQLLDNIKRLGFTFLTRSGLSWGMDDLKIPKKKKEIISLAEKQVEEVEKQYQAGLLTSEERYHKVIEIWARVKEEMSKLAQATLDEFSTPTYMVESGARGTWTQVTQMTGMRGLMTNPKGETIELPVKDSFKEGLDVLEYFISTHGARKGLSDTALRTASAGYLTRRLVDVAQDLVIDEKNCPDKEGIVITKKESEEMTRTISERILGRTIACDIKGKSGKVVIKKGELITREKAGVIEKLKLDQVRIFSILTCQAKRGVCQRCYGWDLGSNIPVKIGEAVGIIAAQSIGEPGTQLTLRTFHTGGVAGEADITLGLPRVEELFEARKIKSPALITEIDGLASVEEKEEGKIITITSAKLPHQKLEEIKLKVKKGKKVKKGEIVGITKEGDKIKAHFEGVVKEEKGKPYILGKEVQELKYTLPPNSVLWVKTGDKVEQGQQLSEGRLDLRELYEIAGKETAQKYILKEIQRIYTSQGQDVNDKHMEIIIRQMFSRIRIVDPGESDLLPGETIERSVFEEIKEKVEKEGKKAPQAQELLLGITKASLSIESFLSAASFQETSRILIDAATTGKVDRLRGLKENVIIGRLIPCGTGYRK